MRSHAILMHYPPEALDEIRHGGGTEVLAIGDPAGLETFLADYRQRHQTACAEWDAWDDSSREWDESFDIKHAELCERHNVSAVIPDVRFEIVEIFEVGV